MANYTVLDVAQWFLAKEPMTHKKLQKLCYYAQAWHLALLNEPLFNENVEAWIHGPVIPALYAKYADYGWSDIPTRESSAQFPANTAQVLGRSGTLIEDLTVISLKP